MDATAAWIFDIAMPIVFLALLAYWVRDAVRHKRVSTPLVVMIGALSMSWQEFIGDWGVYLLWSPDFVDLPWDSTWYATPIKPLGVIPGYPVYFMVSIMLILTAIAAVRARKPGWNTTTVSVGCAIVVFYAFSLLIESTWISLGWYSYTQQLWPWLPALTFDNGGIYPLVYPLLAVVAMVVVLVLLLEPHHRTGKAPFDRFLPSDQRVDAMAGGPGAATGSGWWRREILALLVWMAIFNAVFFVIFSFGGNLLRVLIGPPSQLVP